MPQLIVVETTLLVINPLIDPIRLDALLDLVQSLPFRFQQIALQEQRADEGQEGEEPEHAGQRKLPHVLHEEQLEDLLDGVRTDSRNGRPATLQTILEQLPTKNPR